MLQLCLPNKPSGDRRRIELRHLLNGDWGSPLVEFYSMAAAVDTRQWARRAAVALLPAAIPMFPRTRWVTSERPLAETTLIASCHGLLARAVPHWLVLLRGRSVPEAAWKDTGTIVDENEDNDPWEVCSAAEDTEHEGEDDPLEQHLVGDVVLPAVARAADEDWSEFNERQRTTTQDFVQKVPPAS